MSLTQKDIERPLGQDRRGASGARWRLSRSGVLSVLAGAVIVTASASIAVRDRPFRTPVPLVVTTPELGAAAPAPAQKPAISSSTVSGTGAKIVKVNPPGAPAANAGIVIHDPTAAGQDLRVAHLPDRDLVEDSRFGPLPVRSADGRRPMDVYARPWSGARGARVAIVLGGMAISQSGTQAAIEKLPAEVTIAFSPQGNSIGRWMQAARQKGHEVVMQVPLEPFDFPNVNPGRNTLTVGAGADENVDRLRWALGRTTNYTGVMNFMGARFSTDEAAMRPMMQELGKRGLLYFDDGSSARSLAPDLALENAVPFAAGDATIDQSRDRGAILKKLDELESTARARGFAIGTGSAFDETVDAVTSWVAEAKKRGIEIVPISAVVSDAGR